MPIEIKELHIRINVSETEKGSDTSAPVNPSIIVQQCIDQVMEVVKQQKER